MTREELNKIYDLVVLNASLGSTITYYDKDSNKNLDLKEKVLMKLYNDEELTDDEKYDKRVFEFLPNNARNIIIG